MLAKNAITSGFSILSYPTFAFRDLKKRTLEQVLGDYIKLVLLSGLLAGVVTFLYAIGRAVYLEIVRDVTVNFWRLANYYSGIAVGTFFFYLFAGTFIFFIVSVVANLFTPAPYTRVVMVLCYALTPVLLFGWLSSRLAAALLIWAGFLLIVGLRIVSKPAR